MPPALVSAHQNERPQRGWLLFGTAVVIAVLPLVFGDSYWRATLIICALNVMLAIGLDFILGYAGQLNLGHSAFYGIGAYVSTLVITKLGLPFWGAFLCGIVLAVGGGGVLFVFFVRGRGPFPFFAPPALVA